MYDTMQCENRFFSSPLKYTKLTQRKPEALRYGIPQIFFVHLPTKSA